jgi:hypothetical protein
MSASSKDKMFFTILTWQQPNAIIPFPDKYRETQKINDTGFVLIVPAESYRTPDARSIGELLNDFTSAVSAGNYKPAGNISAYERKIVLDMFMSGLGVATS